MFGVLSVSVSSLTPIPNTTSFDGVLSVSVSSLTPIPNTTKILIFFASITSILRQKETGRLIQLLTRTVTGEKGYSETCVLLKMSVRSFHPNSSELRHVIRIGISDTSRGRTYAYVSFR